MNSVIYNKIKIVLENGLEKRAGVTQSGIDPRSRSNLRLE